MDFAVNHMTIARASFESLLETASRLGCVGVEVRNDLDNELFDGQTPAKVKEMVSAKGLRILALAEVKEFNQFSADTGSAVRELAEIASSCGAQAISLIPANNGVNAQQSESARLHRQNDLIHALEQIKPVLEKHKLTGLIEPLGFLSSTLRSKAEAVQAIDSVDGSHCFKLVHDTFHHFLSGGGNIFAQYTGIVHVSGVVEEGIEREAMRDEHRVLVDQQDRLKNIEQLTALRSAGYGGPISMEAFAPTVHAFTDPERELFGSFDYIASSTAASAA